MLKPEYNEDQPMQIINDFHSVQILKVNTEDVNTFLDYGKKFDLDLPNRADAKGRVKCVYIVDKVPPLSAILNFVQSPFAQGVNWGAYAVIVPSDTQIISKFIPIVTYGLMFTPIKDKYSLKTFDHKHKDDLTEVIEWLNKVVDEKDQEIDVSVGQG